MKCHDAEGGGGEGVADVVGVFGDALEGDDGGHEPPSETPAREEVAEDGGGGDGEGDVAGGEGEVFLEDEALDAAAEGGEVEGGLAGLPVGATSAGDPFEDGVGGGDDAGEEELERAAEAGAVEGGDAGGDDEGAEEVTRPDDAKFADPDPLFHEGVEAVIVDPVGDAGVEGEVGEDGQ